MGSVHGWFRSILLIPEKFSCFEWFFTKPRGWDTPSVYKVRRFKDTLFMIINIVQRCVAGFAPPFMIRHESYTPPKGM